jgi:hypothetical protein
MTRSSESWMGSGAVFPAVADCGGTNVGFAVPKKVHSSAVPACDDHTLGSPIPAASTALSVALLPVVLVYTDVRVVLTVGTMTDLTVAMV